MEGTGCAPTVSRAAQCWAAVQFGTAELGDARRTRRLLALAAGLLEHPHMSLPKQFSRWGDLLAGYRLLSNAHVDPQQILAPHVAVTRQEAAAHPVVLCVQDDTELDFTLRTGIRGLGQTGDGTGRGLRQHTALAVLPDKRLLGILDLTWHAVQPAPKAETRRQRQSRWNVRDVWQETVQHVGRWTGPGQLIQVGDRHADIFRHLRWCRDLGHEFVIRAVHDRYVDEDATRLWAKLAAQPARGTMTVPIRRQRDGGNHVSREGREAVLTIRTAPARIAPPRNDPRTAAAPAVAAWAIYLKEESPPQGVGAVEWMLWSSLPAENLEAARTLIGYYTCRWVIEEWHRGYKEGCRIEASQLDSAADIQRLGAILAVVAVRLLQMRDWADPRHPQAQDPAALQNLMPPLYIRLVAKLSGADPQRLTVRDFFLAVARQGGYLGRKRDPRPGWKVIWRGWYDLVQMARGAELFAALSAERGKCV